MSADKEKYLLLCNAPCPTSPHLEGIVVAADLTQEWLLPWWWEHYSRFNDFPVTFVDLGLSPEMQQWCREKGHYVRLPTHGLFVAEKEHLPPEFVSSLEKKVGNRFWESRQAWFLKPLACLQSPYESTLWIDLDCEIKSSLQEVFSFCRHPSGLSMTKESFDDVEISFNTGVIAFQRGTELIRRWALESFTGHVHYRGDQDLLTALIKKNDIEVGDLPPIYNSLRFNHPNPEAIILHWNGHYGKEVIHHQIRKKNLFT